MPLEKRHESSTALAAPQPATSPRQRAAIIHRIRALMEFWGITATQLQHHKENLAEQVPTRPKYRHPTTGCTWHGQGSQPEWLRKALLKEGLTVEQLREAAAASGLPSNADD